MDGVLGGRDRTFGLCASPTKPQRHHSSVFNSCIDVRIDEATRAQTDESDSDSYTEPVDIVLVASWQTEFANLSRN